MRSGAAAKAAAEASAELIALIILSGWINVKNSIFFLCIINIYKHLAYLLLFLARR